MTASSSRYELSGKRIWVAGHRGMVGAALMRRLQRESCELLTVGRETIDLRRQQEVEDWMAAARPQGVFLAAATVGGILANDARPAEFLYDNLAIQTNILHAAWRTKVEKLFFLGSSCIYPKLAPQPMREDALLTGQLEPTNQWYAVAKIAGIKLAEAYRRQYGADFIAAMPTNLYGPGDNFDLESAHVVSALIAKMHLAKRSGAAEVEIWGTGTPRRELLHVDDCADALVFLMQRYSGAEPVNIGTGTDVTVRDLAEIIRKVVGFEGGFRFDPSKPDGAPRKLLDVSRLVALGWSAKTSLEEGLARTYRWFLDHQSDARGLGRRAAGGG